MIQKRELIQGSEEWLALRRSMITATDATVIMGENPWTTPLMLYKRKKCIVAEQEVTPAMRRGIDLEPLAREKYMQLTGEVVAPAVIFHPEIPYMMASLDGYNAETGTLVEIKCPGEANHKLACAGRYPDYYYGQMQHQLACTGLDVLTYFSYYNDSSAILQVYRDEEYIDIMIDKEAAFYECMMTNTPPDLTKRDYVDRDDDVWVQAAEEWISAKKKTEVCLLNEKKCRQVLVDMCQDQCSVGGGIKLTKFQKKGRVDYAKIPELQNVNLDLYRSASTEEFRLTIEKDKYV